jgi:GNAT superfamily N-acetyltransferase
MIVTLRKDNQVSIELQAQDMLIRQAGDADVQELAQLFVSVTDAMLAEGIGQWHYTYPLAEHIQKDIDHQSCYVGVVGGKIVATITLDFKQDVQYRKVAWNAYGKLALVVHRLAVHPHGQGKGFGRQMMLYAEEKATECGANTIRLDAYSLNPSSNAMYRSMGYRRASGYCFFRMIPGPFYCYDKKIR